jgi:ABC-type branched-subunit amino acid transport system substrate-binding protein
MGKLRWVIVAFIVLLGVVAFACGDDGGDGGTATPSDGTPAGNQTPTARTPTAAGDIITTEQILEKDPNVTKRGELRWGFMFELTGTLAPFGIPTGDGIKLAVQEINDAGGVQIGDTIYTISLVERDTATDIQRTIAVATELVRDENLNVIWGPASTGEPEATQITQPRQIIHLCPCEGRELTALATEELASGENRWAFQTLPPITALFREGPADLKEQFPEYETFALLCRNDDTGRRVCGVMEEAYTEGGFTASIDPGETRIDPRTSDFRPILTRIRATDPDIFINFVDPLNQGTLLKQALELDVGRYYAAVVIPPNVWDAAIGDPRIHERYVGWGGFPRQQLKPTSEEARAYFEKFEAFSPGQLVPFVSLLTYDYVYMLVAAMQQAGTVEDTTAIAEALETLHYDGVGEDDIYFNKRHIAVEGGDACTVYQREATCTHGEPPEAIRE